MSARLRMTVIAAIATLLASLSLGAVFRDGAWFWPVVAAITVAAAGCALGRRLALPRPLIPVLGVAAVTVLVTWLWARDVAVLGVFPGPGAWRSIDQLIADGLDGIRRYSPPAPTDPGLVLLAAGGAGLVAVVVDTLAVTYRSAALAGAPLLALYAVPVTVVRDGVPWLLFSVAALGWLGLLLAEGRERISRWGRSLDTRTSGGDNVLDRGPAEPLGVVGRRIGVAALGLALVVPALLPWSGLDILGGNGGGGGGSAGSGGKGGSNVTTVNPFVSLSGALTQREEQQFFTYTTDDPSPDYLRMVTLDSFDATGTWQPAPTQRASARDAQEITPDAGTDALNGRTVTTTVTMTDNYSQAWLPMPYPAQGLEIRSGSWRYDDGTQEVFANRGTTTLNSQYRVTSRHLELTAAELTSAPTLAGDNPLRTAETKLPTNIPASVRALSAKLTDGLATDYEKALAIQQYFLDPKNGFTYTTDVPDAQGNALVSFLITNKKGFCQQYAGAFAVLARLAGLPTRVDVGFTPGTQDTQTTNTYLVTNHNAHAWPEVYFSGYGWVRFEPTVGGPSGITPPAWAARGPGGGTNPTDGTNGAVTRSEHNGQTDQRDALPALTPAPVAPTTTSSSPFPWKRLLVLAVLLLALVPGSVRLVRRRRRLHPSRGDVDGRGTEAREQVTAAWTEVADTARDLRMPWSAARTPRRTVDWLGTGGVVDEAAAAANRLAGAVERVNYAPAGVDVLRGADPAADARAVVEAMEAGAERRDRWRARLLPASVLAAGSERTSDVLEAVDRTGAKVRGSAERVLTRHGADHDD